ncbi:ATP-grasp ribosomal peptide maturase [Actinacidiphila guanduensis]|uniref:ATP-grasp ribosomal peptide maturase, SAV_5884 family n=1 Tax=Actinacidiphila guanduensis TaxID=310781 RepID=A0A1H0L4M5_9ACTN|nr:ATP-grasp ribosomal peptide maturase [Actinacidiphila guanduensis]SDO62953.1 ATP-grasp ribosomal peptide maturase, SAV_5884 family [Actinacidiphila guanduensis]
MTADRPVLVVAEQLDAAADMVVDRLNRRGVPVLRYDSADFPQNLTLAATHAAGGAGWRGVLDHGSRSVHLEDVRAVYYRRPGRPVIAGAVPEPYAAWARDQADAALLNVVAALPVRWINNPHDDRAASHKPQQLVCAAACGLRVPRSIITNDPDAARAFGEEVKGPLICKPVLGGRLDSGRGRPLMIATHPLDPDDIDDSIRLTAHYIQEAVPKSHEVRLTVVDDRLFACSITATTQAALTDWRTDPGGLTFGTTPVPESVAAGVRRYLASYGLVFGAFDFAVTPQGDWVFFECNPAGTWAWVESHTGLPIAAAHADYLQGAQ